MKNIIDDAQFFYRNLNKSNMTMGDFVASERKETAKQIIAILSEAKLPICEAAAILDLCKSSLEFTRLSTVESTGFCETRHRPIQQEIPIEEAAKMLQSALLIIRDKKE